MRRELLIPIVGVGLLLSACLPEGQRLPQSPLLSALEPKSGRIAFVGLDRNVYILDQAGAGLTAVTEDAAPSEDLAVLYRTPTWSPESDRLALLRHTFEAGDVAASSIVIAEADGPGRTVAFESEKEHPIYLSWSPVGDHVTLLTGRATDSAYKVWNIPAAGGEAQLVDAGRPVYWSWAPGGDGLLAHIDGSIQDNPGTARISLLQLGPTVSEQRLDVEPFIFQAPSFSPAGDLALIAGYARSGTPALLLTTPLGDSVAELAPLETAAAFGWSPTGRYAAYIHAEPNQPGLIGRLFLVALTDPEDPVTIETGDSLVVAFDWAPNGEQILSYAPAQGPPETEGGDPTLLLQLRVTQARSGDTRRLGTFRPTDDFVNLLPFFDQYAQSSTAWSPDSRNIVFTAQTDDGTSAVFVLAASGTVEPRGIAEGVYAVWSWR
jgi:hypothetical protein